MVWWVKDPALPQLWLRLQLQLRSDSWPGSSTGRGAAKKRKKTKNKKLGTSEAGKDSEARAPSYVTGGNEQRYSYAGKRLSA